MKQISVPREINHTPEWDGPDYRWSTRKALGLFTRNVPPQKDRNYDSRWKLESLGFNIVRAEEHHYLCDAPGGASVNESGYTTDVWLNGTKIISCFDKSAYYDVVHHATFFV